jgi:hypothetical protein
LQDVRYSAYFLILPFFLSTIKRLRDVRLVTASLKVCAVVLAAAYAAVQLAIASGLLSVEAVRDFAANTADFAPRLTPEISGSVPFEFQVFFYSGFVYLGVGVILFSLGRSLTSKLVAVSLLIVLFCTLTRGFLVALGAVVLVYATLNRRSIGKSLVVFSVMATVAGVSLILSEDAIRERSDNIRTETTMAVLDQITPTSLLLGHGFGAGVPLESRFLWEQRKFSYIHMENAFAEVLHKQGLVGIAFYAFILVIVTRLYFEIRKVGSLRATAEQFFLGTVYIYVVSIFNPYVTNSIGMGFVCLAIAVLSALRQRARKLTALERHLRMYPLTPERIRV